MASNIYTQVYSDGTQQRVRRSTKQGRPPQIEELKMVRINITMSPAGRKIIKQRAREMKMSFSSYLELSGVLYTPKLVNH